ncbi:MAG: hypothetical protein PUG33_02405 [Mollicutes bacterium]|nr:hypothetical protein [Mollicutes bacterium]
MKNEKKENENVMSSQDMRACMNKIFDNGMATKRYDAMIAMLNMIGHSVLLLNDIVVRGNFCVLTLDDLNLLEYDVEEHSDKNIMDDNKMNVIKLLNICCLGNPKEYFKFEECKKSAVSFFGDEKVVDDIIANSGKGFITLDKADLKKLVQLFNKETVTSKRMNELNMILKLRYDCTYISGVPYIIDKEEFENIPIALRNVYYRPNKYNKQDTLVKKL